MSYVLKENLANSNNYGTKRNTNVIEYIVIHFTANDGDTDENNGKYFHNNVVYASAHYFVDSDSITNSVPDNYVAYSVGGSKYNNNGGKYYGKATNINTLNIEICDDVKNGTIYPSKKTIENAIAFTKTKMKQYGIDKNHVIRHYDVTGKPCPAYWCGTTAKDEKWKTEFWNKLTATTTTTNNTSSSSSTSTSSTFKSYEIKVSGVSKGDTLKIREKADPTSKEVGKLSYNDHNKYTIVEEKKVGIETWGKLKSGTGWINLRYTTKVTSSTSSSSTTTKSTTNATTTTTKVSYYTKCASKCTSFVDALKSINVDSSLINRTKIAKKNGVYSYSGTSTQNTKLLDLLKKGKLIKA